MTAKLVPTAAALLVILAGPAAAACVGARNNTAFSTSAATGSLDPCDVKARLDVPKPAKPATPVRKQASALDVPAAPPPAAGPTTTVDEDGRTVTRIGNTEIRMGGSVRFETRGRIDRF